MANGTRLTNEVAEEIVEQVRRSSGRPSLSGKAAASPQIAFRVAPAVRDRAAEVAAREGKTISQLAREALEQRVAASRTARSSRGGALRLLNPSSRGQVGGRVLMWR